MIDIETLPTISEVPKNRSKRRKTKPLTTRAEREKAIANRRRLRDNTSPITSSLVRNQDSTSRYDARADLSPNAQSKKRADDSGRRRANRDNETMMEREERLGLARQRRHQRRFTHANYKKAYFDPNEPFPFLPAYSIGSPDLICEHCGSKYWVAELNTNREFTKCCQKGIIIKNIQKVLFSIKCIIF